jgi:hypothetical protein
VLLAITAFISWKYIPDQVNQGKLVSISAVHSIGDEDLDATRGPHEYIEMLMIS